MSTSQPAPGSVTEAALRLASQGEFASAIGRLESALTDAASPEARADFAATLADIARAAEAAEQLDAAQRALESASKAVDWADLHCRLGVLRSRRGQGAGARAALDRALAINPRYRTATVERALLDAREGRIVEAMQTLRALAADGALSEPGAFREGLEHLRHAAFEDAAPLLRRALPEGDGWLEEQLRRYQEHVFAEDMPGGLALLRAAAAQRPGYPDLQLLLGAHERRMGAYDDALASLATALEQHPDYHAARVELARTLELIGDTTQAMKQLELVLALDEAHPEALALHGRLASRRTAART